MSPIESPAIVPAVSAAPKRDPELRVGALLTTSYHPEHRSQTEVFDNATAETLAAEALGFDHVWVLEHHFTPYGLCSSTFSMAGYLLGKTTRIKVGTAIIVAPLDHPVRIAEQVCQLDQLSHGRFIAGLGRGFFPQAMEVFGVDAAGTTDRLREWTAILRQACIERTVEWNSDLIKIPHAVPLPEPFTKPCPPIYISALSPSTVEWAASLGIPLLLQMPFEFEALHSTIELYDATAEAHGHDPAEVDHVLAVLAHISSDRRTAQEEILDTLVWWTKEGDKASLTVDMLKHLPNYRHHYTALQAAVNRGEGSVEGVVRKLLDSSAIGSPEECVECLRRVRESTGIRSFAFGFESLLERDRIVDMMDRFATEVLPHV